MATKLNTNPLNNHHLIFKSPKYSGPEWIRTGSNRLLVTIGESWTRGGGLGDQRLESVYGRQLATMLKADWCNVSESGQSNLWIANHLEWVCGQLSDWNYSEVDIILTMTEVGREFNGDLDSDRKYTEILKSVETFDQFLDCLSDLISEQITPYLKKHRIWIGTNFIDPNYKGLGTLDQSWLDLIAIATGQTINQDRCLVVSSWVYDRFDAIFEFCPNIEKSTWLNSVVDHMTRAQHTVDLLMNSDLNYKRATKHPNHQGHELWARYLYDKIISHSSTVQS